MLNELKTRIRDLLPKSFQVPLKYWFGRMSGSLEEEMALLELLVRKQDLVVDVGGNRGVYAYPLWRAGAVVEVFEPNPTCYVVLDAWAAGKKNVHLHSEALSSESGSASLHIPVDESGLEHDASASIEHGEFEHVRDQLVSLQTLDSFCFDRVRLIRIDVEGHELGVIAGAEKTLATSRPALLIEIEQRHNSKPIGEVFETIRCFGYHGYYMSHGMLVSLHDFDVERDQSIHNFGNPDGVYINNFLFLHKDRLDAGEYAALADGYMK